MKKEELEMAHKLLEWSRSLEEHQLPWVQWQLMKDTSGGGDIYEEAHPVVPHAVRASRVISETS